MAGCDWESTSHRERFAMGEGGGGRFAMDGGEERGLAMVKDLL